jgi:hypothetical protein
VYGHVDAGVDVVPDANANAVALVYDLVGVDLTGDEGRSTIRYCTIRRT